MMNKLPKLVLFGAGKIGRSFIGQLFSKGGYEVVFIDVFKPVIDALNRRGNYNVIIKSDTDKTINIPNVRGVLANDTTQVIAEIATAEILAISVGMNGMATAFPLIAEGLKKRYETNPTSALDIIIAENMRNADAYFAQELKSLLPEDYPFLQLVGLIETSIGKMVPIMLKKDMDEDILQVFAESYNTLILSKNAFKTPIPQIEGLAPKANMKAWVDRKLFIHNLGHAATAYIGYVYNPDFVYLYEALSVTEIYEKVRNTMLQAAEILLMKYPEEFSRQDLINHIDDLLLRFQNKALGDTIFRVGCDLTRKLSKQDRVVGAINTAIELGLEYDKIVYVLACAMNFRAKNEQGNLFPGDEEFIYIFNKGVDQLLNKVCEFNKHEIELIKEQLNSSKILLK
ncbi:MAG: mannitol-1-phosphate 5-dehydrogenase [Paludibacter sp.]|nr:mannitol-1-phosphate 5-dehydrogenase [Paludibacter sp.]